jgi:hypothetical protein
MISHTVNLSLVTAVAPLRQRMPAAFMAPVVVSSQNLWAEFNVSARTTPRPAEIGLTDFSQDQLQETLRGLGWAIVLVTSGFAMFLLWYALTNYFVILFGLFLLSWAAALFLQRPGLFLLLLFLGACDD